MGVGGEQQTEGGNEAHARLFGEWQGDVPLRAARWFAFDGICDDVSDR